VSRHHPRSRRAVLELQRAADWVEAEVAAGRSPSLAEVAAQLRARACVIDLEALDAATLRARARLAQTGAA
jgi:hypothetical protein